MARLDVDAATARAAIFDALRQCDYWLNDLYQVAVDRFDLKVAGETLEMAHLCIRRRDGKPIFRDWRHFQQIKNEIAGRECEGVELYPAESRLNDTSNKFHLYVCTDPTYRIPFGMPDRDVQDDDGTRLPGRRQRRFA
jgi:hypothetical protein